MSHWLTNRGKWLLTQGHWDDAGAAVIKVGLLVNATGTIPAAIDTEAEIQDLNTVGELLALTGVDEPTSGWYTRVALTRNNASEDDTNNRVNLDSGNASWTAAVSAAGETNVYGFFVSDATVDTNDTTRLFMSLGLFVAPGTALNGSNLDLAITDLYSAV